jgi:RND family efflux transporter MFP subunit
MKRTLTKGPVLVFLVSLVILGLVLFISFAGGDSSGPGRKPPPGGNTENNMPGGQIATSGNIVSDASVTQKRVPKQSTTPSVKVTEVTPQTYQATVSGYGSASAHYQLALNSRVSGQVMSVADDFEVGLHVQAGQVLLYLENSTYRAALAASDLAYQEAQREAEQARAEWSASGLKGEPESPLVFYEPQLQEARSNYEAAKTNYDDTQVKATFDGVVTSREVAPGSYISVGSELGEMVSSDRVEVSVPLSSSEWTLLPTLAEMTAGNWAVTLFDVETGLQWQGRVLRAERQLDTDTRQRSIIIAVDKPFEQSPALLPGIFVEAFISGKSVDDLWKLPSSSLSQRGEIWYVDAKNTLQSFNATPAFTDNTSIFIRPPQGLREQPQRVLITPMNSYVKGAVVEAQVVNSLVSDVPVAGDIQARPPTETATDQSTVGADNPRTQKLNKASVEEGPDHV